MTSRVRKRKYFLAEYVAEALQVFAAFILFYSIILRVLTVKKWIMLLNNI